MWVFAHLILVRFARGLSILFIFSKNQLFVSLILCIFFFCLYFINFSLIFIISLPLVLCYVCSCFPRSLRCSIRSFIWDLSILLMCTLMAINFPLKTAFAVSHWFWKVLFSFLLTPRNCLISSLISSMTHWSLSDVLFSLQWFEFFLLLLLLLSSSFIALWSDRMQGLFLFSYICWGLLYTLRYDLLWRKFHGLLRRMYLMLLQDEIFCRHQLGSFDLWCHLVLEFHCWFFVWMAYLLVLEWY
jgi:hypothetical protein